MEEIKLSPVGMHCYFSFSFPPYFDLISPMPHFLIYEKFPSIKKFLTASLCPTKQEGHALPAM